MPSTFNFSGQGVQTILATGADGNQGAFFGVNKETQLEYDNREKFVAFKVIAFHKHGGFRSEVAAASYAKIDDHVRYDNRPFTVVAGSKHLENARIADDEPDSYGRLVEREVAWGDPLLVTDAFVNTSFQPFDGDNPHQGFVQVAGVAMGTFAWRLRENDYVLVVLKSIDRSNQTARVANCIFNTDEEVSLQLLHHAKSENLPPRFALFQNAVLAGPQGKYERENHIPGNLPGGRRACTMPLESELALRYVPKPKRGKPPGYGRLPEEAPDYVATPELARALEQNRQQLALKGKRDGERFNVVYQSDLGEDWGEPEMPLEKGGAGNFMMPVLALGAMAAFVLTR